jgi:hypothetical protein
MGRGDEGKWKGLQKVTDSCNVVNCAAVTGWGDEGKRKGLQKCTDSCNVVMCAAVTGWGRRREMERVTERY